MTSFGRAKEGIMISSQEMNTTLLASIQECGDKTVIV